MFFALLSWSIFNIFQFCKMEMKGLSEILILVFVKMITIQSKKCLSILFKDNIENVNEIIQVQYCIFNSILGIICWILTLIFNNIYILKYFSYIYIRKYTFYIKKALLSPSTKYENKKICALFSSLVMIQKTVMEGHFRSQVHLHQILILYAY